MALTLPRILVIDRSSERAARLQWVLQFLEYEADWIDPSRLDNHLERLGPYHAIFVGYDADHASADTKILSRHGEQCPLVWVAERADCAQLAATTEGIASTVLLPWPSTYSALMECLEKVQVGGKDRRQERRSVDLFRSLTGESEAIQRTRKLIRQVADSEVTVLILGESGTGKEVVARHIHYYSSRKNRPFVAVNCGAIPRDLLESELFGHEKGAFTGALSARQGRFESAEGGTLFLDEVGDMPIAMQVKLLRVLQERTFERVGSNKTVECDVRIIAATHRNLEEEITAKRFREDLYYRLNVFPIEVPALRERLDDIPALVADLVERIESEKRGSVRLTASALERLQHYRWPGNVRELANLIERLTILHPYGIVDAAELPEKFQGYDDVQPGDRGDETTGSSTSAAIRVARTDSHLPENGFDLKRYLDALERDLIEQALRDCDGIVARAARRLKMRRTTLVEKLRKFGLQRL